MQSKSSDLKVMIHMMDHLLMTLRREGDQCRSQENEKHQADGRIETDSIL
jgi:hypothetical protein